MLHYVLRLSKEIGSQFIQTAIDAYKQLFFYDPELKTVLVDHLKETDEREFKKFIATLTQPYFEDLGKVLSKSVEIGVDSESLGICLSAIFKDYKALQDIVSSGIKNYSLLDHCKKLTFDTLKQHVEAQTSQLL